jgi:hypothetical protein
MRELYDSYFTAPTAETVATLLESGVELRFATPHLLHSLLVAQERSNALLEAQLRETAVLRQNLAQLTGTVLQLSRIATDAAKDQLTASYARDLAQAVVTALTTAAGVAAAPEPEPEPEPDHQAPPTPPFPDADELPPLPVLRPVLHPEDTP